MGGTNRITKPNRGSRQFWPRVRAKKETASIRTWPASDSTKLLGFVGYKVGMTNVNLRDNNSQSMTKGQNIAVPCTIIECPPIKPLSIRFYQNTHNGPKIISEIFASKVDKNILASKKPGKVPESFDDLTLSIYTQPKLIGFKKKANIIELGISGSKEEKLKLAQELLEKEIKVSDVFKDGQFLDTHSVTKGKGFQGTVKRYGVKIRQHKSEKVKRGIGNLGSWTPKRVSTHVAQPGKMGYHRRTEYNKWLMKISSDPKELNPKGGFVNYGEIKNDCIIVKGSVSGPAKRAITLTEPMRFNGKNQTAEIKAVDLESKQQ
jgi:large subunit ribosomal protein L3